LSVKEASNWFQLVLNIIYVTQYVTSSFIVFEAAISITSVYMIKL